MVFVQCVSMLTYNIRTHTCLGITIATTIALQELPACHSAIVGHVGEDPKVDNHTAAPSECQPQGDATTRIARQVLRRALDTPSLLFSRHCHRTVALAQGPKAIHFTCFIPSAAY